MRIVHVDIDDEMRAAARVRADRYLEQRTIDNHDWAKDAAYTGALGEVVANKGLGGTLTDNMNHDICVRDHLAELKSLKHNPAAKPHADYNGLVADRDWVPGNDGEIEYQTAPVYIFLRIQRNHHVAWIMGWIESEKFFELSTPVARGQFHEGMTADYACQALHYDQMNEFNHIQCCNGVRFVYN